ncbi:hypothetical protein ACDH54_12020 [Pseudomonas syringae]|uniref:hypothetical protein n=1 Tax=Pseudomonas syringae TaxID=317 RepID=UPI003531C8DF
MCSTDYLSLTHALHSCDTQILLIIVPMLCVGMQFWTLCVLFVALRVTQRFCDFSDVCLRLKAPFRPSATYFDGAKAGKSPGSVSGPTSSGSFALPLIRGPLQRAILGPVQLARRPASHPPDQRQSSAVTYVALCVVNAIAMKNTSKAIKAVTNCMTTRSVAR